jgi:hypothetical protein
MHLSNAYRKLDIGSRGQFAIALNGDGAVQDGANAPQSSTNRSS